MFAGYAKQIRMPNIAVESISERVAPLDEDWHGCVSHLLNAVMKTCLHSFEKHELLSRVSTDLKAVKTLVRVFRQSS